MGPSKNYLNNLNKMEIDYNDKLQKIFEQKYEKIHVKLKNKYINLVKNCKQEQGEE